MNRLALVLIAALLPGCASTTKPDTAGSLPLIPASGWQQLQAALQQAPVDLHRAIAQAVAPRLQLSSQTEPQAAAEASEPRSVLLDILTHTDDQYLLPDAEFASLHNVVLGAGRDTQRSYAEALRDYLTQADFNCRQPLHARYFQRRYAANQMATPCRDKVPFLVFTQYEGAKTVWIDPGRVKSIHLLFASKSQSMASRFGHVALRLVICPEGKNVAAECDANLFEHVVLGFQAYIDELSLDTLKALNGSYKAYLFANRFLDVYQQYAIDEFREVYSLPLRMDDEQRELMVRELADIHWRYAGEYSFFTRNCATMMQDALQASWPELSSGDKMSSYLRPDSLFDAIKSSPWADGDKLSSLEIAEREGYFFSSTRQFYERALIEVRAAMKNPAFADLGNYVAIHPIKRRQARAEDKQFSLRLVADQRLREAQLMLEEYALLHSERLMMIEAARYIEQQDFLAKADSIHAQLDAEHAQVFDDCLLTPIRQHFSPMQRLGGIPTQSEIPAAPDQLSVCMSIHNRKLLREAIAGIKDAENEQWQKLNEISHYWAESIANINLLRQL